jgi:hypothetical protein
MTLVANIDVALVKIVEELTVLDHEVTTSPAEQIWTRDRRKNRCPELERRTFMTFSAK